MLVIPSLKKKTKYLPITAIADSKDLYVPLNTYNGTMTPVVVLGEQVKKYQLLAEASGLFAAKIHAPVSGVVKAFLTVNNQPVVQLENDFLNLEIATVPQDGITLTAEQFIQTLLHNGIQGAGGAQFPTHLKYNLQQRPIHTLIFNGTECEPFLTADIALLREKTWELLSAAQRMHTLIPDAQLVFAIERQHRHLVAPLKENALKLDLKISVKVLPDGYPQGGELQLIKSVTSLELKKGSIPANYGVLVSNIGTLWNIYNALFEGKPTVERVVTVSGNACTHLGNYLIKIGTPIAHVLRETHNEWDADQHMLVLGGAMMGKAAVSPLSPIHKGSGGVLIMRKNKLHANHCIQCGLCVDVCPQKLMPLELVRHNISNDLEQLQQFNLQDCIECGACAYVCPSDVPLMENIFDGKNKLTQPPYAQK